MGVFTPISKEKLTAAAYLRASGPRGSQECDGENRGAMRLVFKDQLKKIERKVNLFYLWET